MDAAGGVGYGSQMARIFSLLVLATAVLLAADPLFDDAVKAFQKEDYSTARMLFESVLATDAKNAAAQNFLRVIAAREKGVGAGLRAAMHKTILPKLDFKDVSAPEAINYIVQQVAKISGGKQKPGVVWLVAANELPPVSLALSDVPADEALRYVCELAGISAEYDAVAIRIVKRQ